MSQSIKFAAMMRVYLMDNEVSQEERHRIALACRVLESGVLGEVFDALGKITLEELKRQYVAYVVDRELTMKAASQRLRIDPATTWRLLHGPSLDRQNHKPKPRECPAAPPSLDRSCKSLSARD